MADASGLWIPVLPSLDKFGPALTKGVAKDAEKAGKSTGKAFGVSLGLAAGAVAGVAAAGTALFNVGKTFQDMTNTIRIGTGAAGEDLDGLVDIAKNVGTKVPADFDAIGNAVADLNTMMGLTGDDLELVSSQVLEAGRMLGEEVDISAVGQSFNAFGIEAEDVSGSLDFLFNVSQATGIGMNDLANQARQAAPAAEVLGFTFEETAGLIGQLDNAGLDSGKMLQNMSRRMKDVAKDGEEPRDTFNRVASEIEEMVESGDRFGAQDLAGTAFGTRNAEQFIKAIEDGTLNLEDLTGAAAHSGDTIMGLSEETMTFGEHWDVFKNNVLIALEPVAARVFGGMSDLMDNLSESLVDDIIPAFEGFVGWVVDAKDWLVPLVGVLGGFAAAVVGINIAMGAWSAVTKAATAIQAGFNAVMALNPIMLVVIAIAALVAGLVYFFTQTELGQEIWEKFTTFLGEAWENIKSFFVDTWENHLQPVFESIGDWIGRVIDWFADLGDDIPNLWGGVVDFFADSWENIKSFFSDALDWIVDLFLNWTVYGLIIQNWDEIADFFSESWENIKDWFADGVDGVKDGLSDMGDWFADRGEDVSSAWSSMADTLTEKAGEIKENALDFLQTKMGELKEFFTDDSTAIGRTFNNLSEELGVIGTWINDYVFEPYKRAFNLLRALFSGDSEMISDAWHDLKNSLHRTYQEIVARVTEPFKQAFAVVRDWFASRAESISTAWENMKSSMVSVYDAHIKPMFDVFGDAISGLKDKFQSSVDRIKKVWERLKGIAANPIKFVIDDVLNDGLIAGFNTLKNLIPFMSKDSDIGRIPVPKSLKGYSSGGWTGPGGRLDPAGIVHADEFVVRKASRGRFERENPGLLDHVNRYGTLSGYASGGLVRPVSGPLTSGFGAGRGRYPHAGVDWAVPIGTPVKAALAGTVLGHQPVGRTGRHVFLSHPGNRNTYYGHLSRPMVSPGQDVSKGQVIGLSGNTGNSTGPHLHFETWTGGKPVNPLSYMGGLPASAGGGETGGGGWFDPLAPLRAVSEKISGWFSDKFPLGGKIVDVAKDSASGVLDSVIDWVKDKIPFMGDPEDTAKGSGTVSKGPVQDQVKSIADGFGWGSGAEWSALSSIIQKESSWDPMAANPSSTARGLFQMIAANRKASYKDVPAHTREGLNYIKGRYGSPSSALAFHNRNNWYADGGLVDPLFRDQGGNLPPGLSMVLNNSGRDEAILNHQQWSDIHKLATRGSGGPGVHIENAYALSSAQLARDIAIEQRRSKALQLI